MRVARRKDLIGSATGPLQRSVQTHAYRPDLLQDRVLEAEPRTETKRKIQISVSASQRRRRLSKDMKTEPVNNPYNFAKDLMPSLSVTLTEAIMETRLEYFSSIDSSRAAAGTSPYRGFMTPAELLGTGCIIADEINSLGIDFSLSAF